MRNSALSLSLSLLLASLVCVVPVALRAGSSGKPIEIWFKPLTWTVKESGHGVEYSKHDFPALLKPDAPWQTAASQVSVLGLPQNVVWSYPDRPELIGFFARNRFKVAFVTSMMFTAAACGKGVEGISPDADVNRETVIIAQKWKEAGGSLDYIIMDSPYYFGHAFPKGCRYAINDVAQRTATTLARIVKYFPNVQIVDAEGPGAMSNDAWLSDMGSWFKSFQEASGRSIYAVAMDLHWTDLRPGNTWQQTARKASDFFHGRGVRSGLYINTANQPGMTDAEWMEENRQHIRDAVAGGIDLDFFLISSWHNHPRVNLPESDPTSYTSLVEFASEARQPKQSLPR